MSAFMCARCAAPLPPEAAEGKVPCPYCGALNAPHEKPSAALVVDLESLGGSSNPAKTSSKLGWRVVWILLVLGIVPMVLMVVVGTHLWPLSHKPSSLKDLPNSSWRALDMTPPPEGYSVFDPAASLPWASTLARQWAPDARLDFIEVDRLRPDGTVNVQNDSESEVQYRFISPALMAEYERQAEFGKTKQITELFLRVRKGGVSALVASAAPNHDDSPPWYDPKALPFPKIMKTLSAEGKLHKHPYFIGQMYFGRDGTWWWDLKSLSRGESLAHVNAETGIHTQ